jgi:hypothetical protein
VDAGRFARLYTNRVIFTCVVTEGAEALSATGGFMRQNMFVNRCSLTAAFGALIATGTACSPEPKGWGAERNGDFMLKCEGAVSGRSVMPGLIQTHSPEPQQFSFRVRQQDKEMDVWREAAFEPLCPSKACVKIEKDIISFNFEQKGDSKESFKNHISWMNIDRKTGAIKYRYFYEYERTSSALEFNGTCQKSTEQEISRTKF